MESRMAKLSNAVIENTAKKDLANAGNKQVRISMKLLFVHSVLSPLLILLILFLIYKLGFVWYKQVTQKLEDELKICKYELHAATETITSLKNEKLILEQKLSALEKRNAGEVT